MKDSYYDLDSRRVFVRGFRDSRTIKGGREQFRKWIDFPTVINELYLINQYGVVTNSISGSYLKQTLDEKGEPCVNLSSIEMRGTKKCFIMKRYRVVDLVACAFIRDSKVYLERGCIASHKNGKKTDNYYTNIEYHECETKKTDDGDRV